MKIKANKSRLFLSVILAVVLLNVALSLVLFPVGLASAGTATTAYSNVFDDLSQADNFDVGLYPSNSSDSSVYVIQIAESISKELFIYTYQPCQRTKALDATKINMSLSNTVTNTRLYDLRLVSQEGVFCKYIVNDVVVDLTKPTRYYNITSIYRKWRSSVDSAVSNDNAIEDVALSVGQCWMAWSTSDGSVRYDVHEEEVVNITSQFVGFRRLPDGFKWSGSASTDSHFIAFNCDHAIDKLLSATIEFDTTVYKKVEGSDYKYEDPVHCSVDLYDYQVASNDGSGWFGKYEEWHRMTSVNAFCKEVEVSDEEKKTLSQYDWILSFYETSYEREFGGKDILYLYAGPIGWIFAIKDALTTNGTVVSNVSLLRLEFEYAGEIYNLGVVSNIQSGNGTPTNSSNGFDLLAWLEEVTGVPKWVWIVGAMLIPLAILLPVLSAIFPMFGELLKTIIKGLLFGVKALLKGLLWLIKLPFKIVSAIVSKVKDRG